MAGGSFTFKQFTIEQDMCAMKVGTDGCLIGAWADFAGCQRVLDVGCGSGLIAIMAAQRSDAHITGVEIDADAARQARSNADNSPWGARIEIVNSDFLSYITRERFDAIVSNPPFFKNSLKCPEERRNAARHDTTLPCASMLRHAASLLVEGGTLSVVIPSDMLAEWCDEALFKGLSPRRIARVHTLPHKQAKRVLLELVKGAHPVPDVTDLILEDRPGEYSKEAKLLMQDFYLKI